MSERTQPMTATDQTSPETAALKLIGIILERLSAIETIYRVSGSKNIEAIREELGRVETFIRGLAQSPDQWRPIETAPKDGTWIITISHPWSSIPVSLHWDGSRWWDDNLGDAGEWQPTHWLPRSALPASPDTSTDRPKPAFNLGAYIDETADDE
jgi:hypothetical protein